jgi:hypothetical protein
MSKKDKLILGIIEKDLKGIRKLLKEQEKQIRGIDKNGFDSEIHPAWYLDIRTGLSYTQGYCTGYIKKAEEIIGLLKLSDAKDVETLIAENKKIEAANKKHLKEVFDEVRSKIKKKK